MRAVLLALVLTLAWPALASAQKETILRAGDIVTLSLPGEATLTGNFPVDSDGNLNLPEVGLVPVAGLSAKEAQAAVADRLKVAFRDVERLRLRLLSRRLPIQVLGMVNQPGSVDIPEAASAQVAITAAGGPAAGADLERVQLRRGNRVQVFNYRRYLDTGDQRLLPTLEPLDSLFVPGSTRFVQIMGAVRTPGSYPWAGDLTLLELIAQAGGPTSSADLASVQILDTTGRSVAPAVFDLAAFLAHGGDLSNVPRPGPGATVLLPELSSDTEYLRAPPGGSVFVMGAVGQPGRYAFGPSLTLVDLLAIVKGPIADADLSNISLIHRGAKGPEVESIDLWLFFETGDRTLLPQLQAGDIVFVPGRDRSWLERPSDSTVRLLGAIAKPGRYPFDDQMTILDLLAEAGGPTNDAYQQKIVVVNLSCCRDQARTFDLVKFATMGDFNLLPVIRPGDTVYVPYISQSNYAIFMAGVRDIFQILSTVLIAITLGGG